VAVNNLDLRENCAFSNNGFGQSQNLQNFLHIADGQIAKATNFPIQRQTGPLFGLASIVLGAIIQNCRIRVSALAARLERNCWNKEITDVL
jgi:hypothetical protein